MMLTIILTVYNKEPYLRRALDSLLNQQDVNDDDYEIFAVNDGSTDGSVAILEEYEQRDSRVRILTQQNQGLSMARNNGMETANGEYVWFVDADDIISEKSVSLIEKAMLSHPDVIPIYAVTDGIEKIRNRITPSLTTGKDILIDAKWEHCGVFWIFRKQFLLENNLRFVPGIYHEDAEFTPRMLYLANKVIVIPEVLYTVFHGDEQSITEVPRPQRAYDMVNVVNRLMCFFDEHGERKTDIGSVINNNNAGILNTALFVMSSNGQEEWKPFDKFMYDNRHVLRSFWESPLLKYKLEGLLFKLFSKRYVKAFSVIRKQFGMAN